jgi:hypothetical protein
MAECEGHSLLAWWSWPRGGWGGGIRTLTHDRPGLSGPIREPAAQQGDRAGSAAAPVAFVRPRPGSSVSIVCAEGGRHRGHASQDRRAAGDDRRGAGGQARRHRHQHPGRHPVTWTSCAAGIRTARPRPCSGSQTPSADSPGSSPCSPSCLPCSRPSACWCWSGKAAGSVPASRSTSPHNHPCQSLLPAGDASMRVARRLAARVASLPQRRGPTMPVTPASARFQRSDVGAEVVVRGAHAAAPCS